jgi:hypothetical protein
MPALVVEVVGDTKGLSRDLRKAEAELKEFGRKAEGLQNATVVSSRRRTGTSTIRSTAHGQLIGELEDLQRVGQQTVATSREVEAAAEGTRRTLGSGALAFGAYGAAATVAFDGLQRISAGLKVTGDRATTTSGQVRNFFSELTGGHPVSALFALDVHNQATSWQHAKKQLDDYTDSNRSWLGQMERSTHGVSDFIDKMNAMFGMDRKMDRLTGQFDKLWAAAHPPTTIPFEQIAGGTFGIDPLDHLVGKGKGKAGAKKGLSAAQRRSFFDARIARALDRVQDVKTVSGQVAALKKIAALIQDRIDATDDITRQLNLEDQRVQVNRQIQSLVAKAADDATREQAAAADKQAAAVRDAAEKTRRLAQARRDHIAALKEAADAARETHLEWLEFALERAEATKPMADNIKAQQAIIAFYKQRIKAEGRKVDLVRQLWREEQKLKEIQQQRKAAAPKMAVPEAARTWGTGSNPFGHGGAISGFAAGGAAAGTNALVRRGGGFVVVNQHFNAPTSDRHREARYALNATRAVFDG